jgi:Asp-tRNA(Asn)/Glu-tRNA(Gln) amidotransferase C subunit
MSEIDDKIRLNEETIEELSKEIESIDNKIEGLQELREELVDKRVEHNYNIICMQSMQED